MLGLDNGVISDASIAWANSAADQPFLATLSHSLKGKSLRAARDHGVQYACLTEAREKGRKGVPGIAMPVNHSETSRAAEIALRVAIDSAVPPDPNTWNFDDNDLSPAWRARSIAQRHAQVEKLITAYLRDAGCADAAIITDIDAYDRVFIQFKADFPAPAKPVTLMQIEQHIRRASGERIELFLSEMKDNNRIRRL